MSKIFSATATSQGLTVKAYSGDRCAMLAFDLADHLTDKLAGFAIRRAPNGTDKWQWLGNRLSFDGAYTKSADQTGSKFYDSNVAPFQKFWWLDFPPDGVAGTFRYEVTAMRFTADKSPQLTEGEQVEVVIDVGPFTEGNIEVAFTRGYLSSQAYADEFHNQPYQPSPQGKDGWKFDWTPYLPKWTWLGGHARQTIVDFFNEIHAEEGATLDAFVYDLNEPEIITAFIDLAAKGKLRLLADNATLHAPSTDAGKAFVDIQNAASAGTKNDFQRGKFGRFQHNKVLIKRVGGVATKVLMGSTNFSITGLYVNANHVLVFNDAQVAAKYATAFDAAFKDELSLRAFHDDEISMKEYPINEAGMPALVVTFAPHENPQISLKRVLDAIDGADSSVIFAVMDLNGQGEVLKALSQLHGDEKVFSYGISDSVNADDDTINGTTVFTPSSKGGELVYSKANPEKFPPPFSSEMEVHGPAAHIVHHKFVVVDFNGTNPVVFVGSSNLAEGGEKLNGDNLMAVYDRAIATAFAIEGIRLVDHYAFAEALKKAGSNAQPLRLKFDGEKWWSRYYTANDIREKERKLFSR
ncbi:phospholipase D-like domain-containing protein [Paraburkholderia sp. D15]|uniref:phospholipase D-like domain-containing protein n=1 Tax=Paraburkholderia sp. D15 TaxID=2880218 RepID=UPI0024787372|nr:phospholipase D-like domain-containing protein [Paraburkholderia sp. D15]WGS51423.1 phospholipase D-like domain-containing protein [Paraburkholderia sp. D15]